MRQSLRDGPSKCVGIEWLDGEVVCYSGDSLPAKAMSNMRYARALAAFERGSPRWWWSNPGQSAERFAAAETRHKSYDASRDTNAVNYASRYEIDISDEDVVGIVRHFESFKCAP